MPTIVDESDLEIASETDLESVSQTAAKRRAAIEAMPPVELQPGPLNPLRAKGALAGLRVAGPVLGATVAGLPSVGVGAALGGAAGAAVVEGLANLVLPAGERPGPVQSAVNVGMQAIPIPTKTLGRVIGPLAKAVPEALVPEALREAVRVPATALARRMTQAATTFKAIPTEAKAVMDDLVTEAAQYAPAINGKDLLEALGAHTPVFGREEFSGMLTSLKGQFDDLGNISLPKLLYFLRTARSQATSRAAKQAVNLAKNDIMSTLKEGISASHPLGKAAGELFHKQAGIIWQQLNVAEDAVRLFGSKINPLSKIKQALADPEMVNMVAALDRLTGKSFLPELKTMGAELLGIPGRAAVSAAERAALETAQARARTWLTGILVTGTGAIGAAVGGPGVGVSGMGSVALYVLLRKLTGGSLKLPFEAAIGKIGQGLVSKAAGQAGAGLAGAGAAGANRLFERQTPSPLAQPPVEEAP